MAEFCKTMELQLNQTLPILNFANVNVSSFLGVCGDLEKLQSDSATEAKYSEPMVFIGWYITVASLACALCMSCDFVVGFYISKKFWVPVKYFSLNAASMTVIAVALKLPMELTSPMPDEMDEVVKVGSLVFLCIMMSNLMPFLASMDTKSLVANVSGLSIFGITMVVNVGIQINTQVIRHEPFHPFRMSPSIAACIYMGMLLFFLMIFISSAVTMPSLKKVVELKYQATLNDQSLQEDLQIFDVEKLRQLLKRHWIMAQTSNPQFVLASTPLSSASSVICATSIVVYISFSKYEGGGIVIDSDSVYLYAISLIQFCQLWEFLGVLAQYIDVLES